MKDLLLGQEPIYPMFNSEGMPTYFNGNPNFGMSKRFYAACAAMQGLLANPTICPVHDPDWVTKHSFAQADELLKQENETNN